MFNRVLVPLDESPDAERILPWAAAIARRLGARLELLRVIDEKEQRPAAEAYLAAVRQPYGATGQVVVAAHPIHTILDKLDPESDTLLAMTTHGRSGVTEEIFGSVAMNIVRTAGRPVLLYRPAHGGRGHPASEAEICCVVVPLDGTPFSESILPHATALAKALGAELHLVQVIREVMAYTGRDVQESGYVRSHAREARKSGVEVSWDVLHGNPAEAIAAYVAGRDNPILAMTSHARAGLSRTFLGGVMLECLRNAGVPVYVYRPAHE